MGKKLYGETAGGGIYFKSERKPWEVRIPNYVYDLWVPVLGIVAIGLYSVYCRLERGNTVKAITMQDIARACRIGKSRLYDENEKLEKCGFIRIAPPEGWQRLAHYTTEIAVLDPPREVLTWAIEKYVNIKDGYRPLCPWLVEDDGDQDQVEPSEVPNGTPVKVPNGTPNVEALGLKPLDVVLLPNSNELPDSEFDEGGAPIETPKPKKRYVPDCEYEHEDGTIETIEDDSWRQEKKQLDWRILGSAGLTEYPTKKDWKKARRVERKLERGEIEERYLENRCYNAENLPWGLDKLLNSLLNPNHYRNWQERETSRKNKYDSRREV